MAVKKNVGGGEEKFLRLPVECLHEAPWNFKQENEHTASLMEKLKENIKRNGAVMNLLVRKLPGKKKAWEVINGNHRLKVYRDLGYKEAMCYDFGTLTDIHAQRIAAETEIAIPADEVKLATLIALQAASASLEDLAATMPQDVGELQRLIELSQWTPDKMPDDQAPYPSEDNETTAALVFHLPQAVLLLWEQWVERCRETRGENIRAETAFEYALAEVLGS